MKMKYIYPILLILFSLGFASSAKAIPMVSLEVWPSPIFAGHSFFIDVVADGVADFDPFFGTDEVLAFGFDVALPAEIMLVGATVGPGFSDDSLLFSETDVAGSVFPGISGDDILLATLELIASSLGDFSLGIASDISTSNEGLITLLNLKPFDITQSIDVTVTPIPEPGTMFLVIGGLVSLGLFKKKRICALGNSGKSVEKVSAQQSR